MAKHYTLRFNIEHRDSFNNIRNGTKRVETRAASVKYRNIAEGDRITFVCGKERFSRTVAKATLFKTIPAVFQTYAVQDIRPEAKTKQEMIDRWYSFPGYEEKIAKYGLIALEFVPSN